MSENNILARKKARIIAMQAVYQWSMSGDELHSIELQYREHNNFSKIDEDYFCELLYQLPKVLTEINQTLEPCLDRELTALNPIEAAILRVATYELLKRLDIPYKVVIHEAMELAKRFGSVSGHKYVNGVLDKVARNVRIHEIAQ